MLHTQLVWWVSSYMFHGRVKGVWTAPMVEKLLYSNCDHARIIDFSDAGWAWSSINRRLTTGDYLFAGENLVPCQNKKQAVILRSSDEFEYRALNDTTCELVWIWDLFSELHLLPSTSMRLYCDNTSASHIVENSIFLERTKQIEVDCNLTHQKVTKDKIIEFQHVYFINQLADILTKPLRGPRIRWIYHKMGHVWCICSSWRGVIGIWVVWGVWVI